MDAPLIDGGEEVLNIRKEKLADASLINLRQAKSLDNVCCAIEDIINDEADDATCDEMQGFKLVSPHFSTKVSFRRLLVFYHFIASTGTNL